jgi:hypothetical protein
MSNLFLEEKAKDALIFEPFPLSNFVFVQTCIIIKSNYSEKLSNLLRSLRGTWNPDERQWEYPFVRANEIKKQWDLIHSLANEAREKSEIQSEIFAKERAQKLIKHEENKQAKIYKEKRFLSKEFLTPDKTKPTFFLKIENININSGSSLAYFKVPSRAWVAQVIGLDENDRAIISFINWNDEYTNSNSKGSRGVFKNYHLEHGLIYKISCPLSWKSTDIYYASIVNSELIRVTEKDISSCLIKLD